MTTPAAADIAAILESLACGRDGCACRAAASKGQGLTHCPAHDDRTPSLSIVQKAGRVLVHCEAGCSQDAVIAALRERGLWGDRQPLRGVTERSMGDPSPGGLTIEQLAAAKRLPANLLRQLGVREWRRTVGESSLVIPYRDPEGREVAAHLRHALDGPSRFSWRKGDHPVPYGLDRLEESRVLGWLLIVEGETDCWTAWMHGIPALGLPGKSTWSSDFAPALKGLQVYVWQEPAAEDFSERIGPDLHDARIIIAPEGIKDLNEAHVGGRDVLDLLEALKASAIPYEQIRRERERERAERDSAEAAPVLAAADPLALVQESLRALGYGGELRPAILVYLAATSRVLALRHGSMLVHLLLLGPPSSGKSYAAGIALRLFPDTAYHEIAAGSPRALIYDDAPLAHRVVLFGEADSLPAGEDNPAASAIRNLLQDGYLHYDVPVRDPKTGGYRTQRIDKAGPTVLVTTATRKLGPQLDSRLFSVEVSTDADQIRSALDMQAELELEGSRIPDAALVAYQRLLQGTAPVDVVVPFAHELATAIGSLPVAARVSRDYARLLSLIKAVTVLRYGRRQRDSKGRLMAELDDYAAVYELVNDIYAAAVTGVRPSIRETVRVVAGLVDGQSGQPATVGAVAAELDISKQAASGRVRAAIKAGFLVNEESRSGHPAKLRLGEMVPAEVGLPKPDGLAGYRQPSTGFTDTSMGGMPPEENEDEGEGGALPIGQAPLPLTVPSEPTDDAAIVGTLRRYHRLEAAGVEMRLTAGGQTVWNASQLAGVLLNANGRLPAVLAELDEQLRGYEVAEA